MWTPGATEDAAWEGHASLGARLNCVLEQRGMSQSELARRTGLSAAYVSLLLADKRGPRIGHATAAALRRALRVPARFFDAYEMSRDVDTRG